MQAQSVRTEQLQDTLTATQSLQSIQTLLRAGLGCITYLRNLLPADNFSESYLTSAKDSPSSINGSFGSFTSEDSRRNVSGFKIMTVTRGYTEEADKLLDYLEYGIFDALQKQYLRSFIFAVYLDNQDPNNIVEAYTFNFHYYNVPGTDVSIPVMTLGDDLMKLSISGAKSVDPVANATKKGKVPTLGEVKRSLKTLIKNLIQATTQMDALPKRRFATFKLFYHEHTPDDYEPPHFRAGDAGKDKWFFTTHDRHEVPEKCSVGQVQTGWHGIDLRVASISGYLPSTEDNNAPFCGTTANNNGIQAQAPPLTPAEEAATRLQQIEVQKDDAQKRKVVWDAEEGLADADAEGEADDDSQVLGAWRMCPAGMEFVGPMGMRDEDGNIVSLPCETNDREDEPLSSAEALFQGVKEKIPRHVGQLELPTGSIECTQTQHIDHTQIHSPSIVPGSPLSSPPPSPSPTPQPAHCRVTARGKGMVVMSPSIESPLPPSDPIQSSELSFTAGCSLGGSCESIDTQMLKQTVISRRQVALAEEDTEMLDMSTQIQPYAAEGNCMQSVLEQERDNAILACECGVALEDCDCLFCEGGCKRWSHVWCMGFHSGTAYNIPKKFICFDCRVRADQNWDLIMVHDLHPRMMAKFRDLALFRRAIKICEDSSPENLAAFTKLAGCESIVAGQLFKRLETEGFIALENKEQDNLGIMETNTRASRSKSKKGTRSKPSRRKTMQKTRYVFAHDIIDTPEYQDYFNPTPEVERRILGLADLKPTGRSRRTRGTDLVKNVNISMPREASSATAGVEEETVAPVPGGSQTQAETQLIMETQDEDMEPAAELKRKTSSSSDDAQGKNKKVKISIGPAVDLGD